MGCIRRLAVVVGLTAALSTASAADITAQEHLKRAASDAALRDALVREGRTASFFCANCHGDAGLSRFPEVPNLASQNPLYMLSQIEAFLAGQRRNDFMQGLMKVLAERDKAAIVLYYAGAAPAPTATAAGSRAGEGAEQYRRLCISCHLPDAHGSEKIPRVAGQQPEYLRVSLKRYLAKSGVRNSPEMSNAVAQLGERNIDPVVEYLATLR
jgi:cytochrome c553